LQTGQAVERCAVSMDTRADRTPSHGLELPLSSEEKQNAVLASLL